jgi:hypothetical protein
MPTSSIPALPSDFVAQMGTAAANFIGVMSLPVEFFVGMFIAFLVIGSIVYSLGGSRGSAELPDDEDDDDDEDDMV